MGWLPVEPSAQISTLIATNLDARSTSYSVTLQQFDDSIALSEALERGEIDLAIIEQPPAPSRAASALMSLYPSVLHILAKPEMLKHPVEQAYLNDIVMGHSLYGGPPGSAGYTLLKRLMADGILPESTEFDLLDSPLGGDPDVYVVFGGILSSDALRRLEGFELLSLGNVNELGSGSWVEGVAIRFPDLEPAVIPRGLYPSIAEKATLTLSVKNLLVSTPELPEEFAYDIVQRVSQMFPEIRAIYPLAVAGPSQLGGSELLNLRRHAGAVRYFERDAPGYLERYAELLALVLTSIVALVSLSVAIVRIRKQAKKDRIDIYLEQVVEIRKQLNGENQQQAELLSQSLVELQATVSRLVVEERIAADSAFVGFIELSNQVLREAADLRARRP